MKYTCVDPVEYLYPDITEYKSSTDTIKILTPRGSYACAQFLIWEAPESVPVHCEGWTPELYEMVAIPVEVNAHLVGENSSPTQPGTPEAPYVPLTNQRTPHIPEREAPFLVYDCLKPCGRTVTCKDGVAGIYCSMWIPADAPVGTISASVCVGDLCIPVEIEVSSTVVPEETFNLIMFYNCKLMSEFHHVEKGTPAYEKLDREYHLLMRRMRQNLINMNHHKPVVTDLGDNNYEFDFTDFGAYAKYAKSMGFKGFYTHLGHSKDYRESTIYVGIGKDIPSTSFEACCYLSQYLPALSQYLEENDLIDSVMLSICDEPKQANFVEYRALSGLVRKLAPKIRQIEPTSYGYTHGYLDTYVLLSNQYFEHMEDFEKMRRFGGEYWYYDCCGPRGGGYINRFMDCPLLAVRYHGWANYTYRMNGYLHWAINEYQAGQDPFVQSCPILIEKKEVVRLPAGDTHIIYPGTDGPWMSVRLENYRASVEEYEMLHALAETDEELADRLCGSVFHSFIDVEYDPLKFRAARNALIRALETRQTAEKGE